MDQHLNDYFEGLFKRTYERTLTPERALAEMYRILGGQWIYFRKSGGRCQRVANAIMSGLPTGVVAERYGISRRQVNRLKRRIAAGKI